MNNIKLTIDHQTNLNLYSTNSTLKGKAVEYVVKQFLLKAGAKGVISYNTKEEQLNYGDLKVELYSCFKNVEVKTSNTFKDKQYLPIDIEYFIYENKKKIPYIQSTTNSNEGWLYSSSSDFLICYNIENSMLYMFKEWQQLKNKLIDEIETYKLYCSLYDPQNPMNFWCECNIKEISPYLTTNVSRDNKYTYLAFMELTEECLEFYDTNCVTIKIELNEEGHNYYL